MLKVRLYTVGNCPECETIRRMLEELDIDYQLRDVTKDPYRKEVVELTGCYSVPQLVIENEHIGGFEEVMDLYRSKKLKLRLECSIAA